MLFSRKLTRSCCTTRRLTVFISSIVGRPRHQGQGAALLRPGGRAGSGRIERLIRALFEFYRQNPPISLVAGATEADRITDYIAGMTDRFALRAFEELSLPRGF